MMLAYHNDHAIKAACLAQLAVHRAADQIVKGQYWENGKGCAIGCLYHSDRHDDDRYGYPELFNWLIDRIFEGLLNGKAKAWPERVANAIKPGIDIDRIKGPFLSWLMLDPTHGVIRFAGDRADVRAAIICVGELWRDGGTKDKFHKAGAAAWAAKAAAAGAEQYSAIADKIIALLEAEIA